MHLHKWSKWTTRVIEVSTTWRGTVMKRYGEEQIRTCEKCGLKQTKGV